MRGYNFQRYVRRVYCEPDIDTRLKFNKIAQKNITTEEKLLLKLLEEYVAKYERENGEVEIDSTPYKKL